MSTSTTIDESAKFLAYEIGMFREMYNKISDDCSSVSDPIMVGSTTNFHTDFDPCANAYLESFLLHTRILLEFFTQQTSNHEDDILLSNFLCASDWDYECKISGDLRSIKDRLMALQDENFKNFFSGLTFLKCLHKRLAHLSNRRVAGECIQWNLSGIHDDINAVIEKFRFEIKNNKPELLETLFPTDD